MRSAFYAFFAYFLTPPGLVLMAALDSSLVFFLPLGIDFVVVILSARKRELFWMYAILASAGSLVGATLTFWIGRKVGEVGLSRLMSASQLRRVEHRVSRRAAVRLAALAIIPPPFPFTAFVLASGAFMVNAWHFFATLAGVRLLRFGLEGALAGYYGSGILRWMESATFKIVVGGLIVLAVVGTIVSTLAVVRSTRMSPEPKQRTR
jgi:membrane protein YqaA with SNARE-associated domain